MIFNAFICFYTLVSVLFGFYRFCLQIYFIFYNKNISMYFFEFSLSLKPRSGFFYNCDAKCLFSLGFLVTFSFLPNLFDFI